MSRIMTDRELLGALDLEHPGLEAVRIAVTTGDLAAAVEQLARDFRLRGAMGDARFYCRSAESLDLPA